jgi:PIN domain nuclease of toxin-antitoxin system
LKLLLDTHVILWCVAEPEKLPGKVAEELESESNELWFSPISVWEILLLAEKGRVVLGNDRFLAATAMVYGLTLVTADRRLIDAKDFRVLPIS